MHEDIFGYTRGYSVTAMLFELRLPIVLILSCIIVGASSMGKRSNAIMALLLNCSSFKTSFSICFYS